MHSLPETLPAVKRSPANEAYRAHLFGDCDDCAVGRWCSVLDRLDYIAARKDSRRAK